MWCQRFFLPHSTKIIRGWMDLSYSVFCTFCTLVVFLSVGSEDTNWWIAAQMWIQTQTWTCNWSNTKFCQRSSKDSRFNWWRFFFFRSLQRKRNVPLLMWHELANQMSAFTETRWRRGREERRGEHNGPPCFYFHSLKGFISAWSYMFTQRLGFHLPKALSKVYKQTLTCPAAEGN